MRFLDSIKRMLPVSSRSYHQRTDCLEQRLAELSEQLNILIERSARLDREARAWEGFRSKYANDDVVYMIAEPGYPNYGDELIAAEWLKYLAQIRPDVPLVLDCARPGPAAAVLRGLHPSAQFVDTVARLTVEIALPASDEKCCGGGQLSYAAPLAECIAASLDDESLAARYVAGIRLLRDRTRGVHYLGGGYMNAAWQENLARMALAPWASHRGITVIGTGLGLTPLDDVSRSFVQQCAASFDAITVRDEGSFKALDGLPGLSIAPDDVFVNGLEGCYSEDSDLPDVMVCIQGDLVEDAPALHEHVINMLQSWSVSHERLIGVVECNPYVDYPVFETLSQAGFSCRLYPFAYLWSCGFPARKGQLWISTRYHPHLLAAAKGCCGSFIPLGSRYYDDKHGAALRMGSRWSAAPIGADVPDPGDGFSDPDIRLDYQRTVRSSARLLYGV